MGLLTERTIRCGDRDVIVTIKRSRRRRTVALRIAPSGALTVHAPTFVWGPFIDRFVRKQFAWIQKKWAYFQERAATPTITYPKAWCKQRVAERLPEPLARLAQAMQVKPRRVTVNHARTRWGSCSTRGDIRFSSRLAMTPDAVFEYVIVHELAHLKVQNHSRRFWEVVETQCPEHKSHRKWLRHNSWTLILLMTVLLSASWSRAESASPASPVVSAPSADHALWEVGLAGAESFAPDYPAAAQKHAKWIVAPYGVYRGKILRADREGARARFLHTRYYEVELSAAASFASRSKDNEARQGMPDLDYLLELGPRISVGLSQLGGRGKLQLFLPLRAVFSTDLGDFQHRGYSAAPALNAHWLLWRGFSWISFAQLTSTFGNRQLNAYFYDVAPAFVRSDRAFYDARGGYMGSDAFVGVLIPVGKRVRLFTGGQILDHSGSANENSPLFKNHVNYAATGGLVWTIFYSQKSAVTIE